MRNDGGRGFDSPRLHTSTEEGTTMSEDTLWVGYLAVGLLNNFLFVRWMRRENRKDGSAVDDWSDWFMLLNLVTALWWPLMIWSSLAEEWHLLRKRRITMGDLLFPLLGMLASLGYLGWLLTPWHKRRHGCGGDPACSHERRVGVEEALTGDIVAALCLDCDAQLPASQAPVTLRRHSAAYGFAHGGRVMR